MNWSLMALKKYATFSGRSQRSEYWYFMLFFVIGLVVASVIDGMLFAGGDADAAGLPWLTILFLVGTILPGLAVAIRRLHDTDRSGWWYLIQLVPLVGPILLIVYCAQDSKPGANRFGANPKGVNA